MSKNSKFKRPDSIDMYELHQQTKARPRTRSTYFEDEVDKAEKRSNRRYNERQLIEDQLDEELSELEALDDEISNTPFYSVNERE